MAQRSFTSNFKAALAAALFAALLAAFAVYMGGVYEAAAKQNKVNAWNEWRFNEFYALPENSVDVLFVGSSHSYCTFAPKYMDALLNVSSYQLGMPNQTPDGTFATLQAAFERQSPKAVVFELYWGMMGGYNAKQADMLFAVMDDPAIERAFYAAAPINERVKRLIPVIRYMDDFWAYEDAQLAERLAERGLTRPKAERAGIEEFREKGYIYSDIIISEDKLDRTNQFKGADGRKIAWAASAERHVQEIAELCAANGAELIVATAPIAPVSLAKIANYDAIRQRAAALCERLDAPYYDYNAINQAERLVSDENFRDDAHLNDSGARIICADFAARAFGDKYPNALYAPVLEAYRAWQASFYKAVSPWVTESYRYNTPGAPALPFVYAFLDMNGDGTDELVLGCRIGDGAMENEVYAIRDGAAALTRRREANEKGLSSFFLYETKGREILPGEILIGENEEAKGPNRHGQKFYAIRDGWARIVPNFYRDGSHEEDPPFNPRWRYLETGEYLPYEEEPVPLGKPIVDAHALYEQIIEAYRLWEISGYTAVPPLLEDSYFANYGYSYHMTEWVWLQPVRFAPVIYAYMDLNADGADELLIGWRQHGVNYAGREVDNRSLAAVYSVQGGEAKLAVQREGRWSFGLSETADGGIVIEHSRHHMNYGEEWIYRIAADGSPVVADAFGNGERYDSDTQNVIYERTRLSADRPPFSVYGYDWEMTPISEEEYFGAVQYYGIGGYPADKKYPPTRPRYIDPGHWRQAVTPGYMRQALREAAAAGQRE